MSVGNVTEIIPHELLGDVFLLVLEYTPMEWFPNPYLSLARLTGVCKRWRDITISDPRLWTTITIEEPDFRLPSTDFLKLCIERSKDLPLSVYLIGAFEDYVWSNSSLSMLTVIIGDEIHRWKSFTYMAHPYTFTPLTTLEEMRFDFSSARQLQSIKIDVDAQDIDSDTPLYNFYVELADLPAPREMNIRAESVFLDRLWRSHSILPSAQVTRWDHLELAAVMELEDAVSAFKHCPQTKLVRLELRHFDDSYDTVGPIQKTPHIVHNTLRALHLDFTLSTEFFSPMISALSFPRLEIFYYEDSGNPLTAFGGVDRASHWGNFLKLISRSQRLRVLLVDHSGIGSNEIVSFISEPVITRIPTVQVLLELEKEARSLLPTSFLSGLQLYADLMRQGPNGLVQASLLKSRRNFLVGWVEKWIAFKRFEGVGNLVDAGFGLHPVLEQVSRPLVWK